MPRHRRTDCKLPRHRHRRKPRRSRRHNRSIHTAKRRRLRNRTDSTQTRRRKRPTHRKGTSPAQRQLYHLSLPQPRKNRRTATCAATCRANARRRCCSQRPRLRPLGRCRSKGKRLRRNHRQRSGNTVCRLHFVHAARAKPLAGKPQNRHHHCFHADGKSHCRRLQRKSVRSFDGIQVHRRHHQQAVQKGRRKRLCVRL